MNGAKFLGIEDRTGSIAAGKQADLMAIEGNPALDIADIEKVRIVFKDGVGYDSAKLLESVKGRIGLRRQVALGDDRNLHILRFTNHLLDKRRPKRVGTILRPHQKNLSDAE